MNFNDTPDEAAFRSKARAFLEANAQRRVRGAQPNRTVDRDATVIQSAKAWQAKKLAGGFAAITWPKEVGGQGGTPIQQIIYAQEEAQFVTPPGVFDWIVNGQKVWTTGAHFCDYGLLLLRTDPDVAKHKGLTMFWVDMKAKGVEARPIRQVSGGAEFNEVFFTDVVIADSQRLGKVGDGWTVALTTLMNERLAVGIATGILGVEDLLELARASHIDDEPAIRNGAIRDRLAQFFIESEGLKYTRYRMWTALSRGETPGPQSSINKVVSGRLMQDLGSLAMELGGEASMIAGEGPGNGAFQRQWLSAAGFRIAGGTDEILRNIIAERVLGMPPDVRVDKDATFAQLEAARAKR